jgi:hypothetical protein
MVNRTTKYGLLSVGLLSVLIVGIVLSGYPTQHLQNGSLEKNVQQVSVQVSDDNLTQHVEGNTEEVHSPKIIIPISGTLAYLNFTELNQRSELIVVGTVKKILPSKWNTPDGKRENDSIDNIGENATMYTDIIITADRYLKNPLNQKEVRVRIEGGEDEVVGMVVDYEPSFKEGEKVLLYLREDTYPLFKEIGPKHYLVSGYNLGKFTLTDDGLAVRLDEQVNQTELLDSIEKGYEPSIKSIEEVKE